MRNIDKNGMTRPDATRNNVIRFLMEIADKT